MLKRYANVAERMLGVAERRPRGGRTTVRSGGDSINLYNMLLFENDILLAPIEEVY